jgi:hypothetical protein
LEVISTLFLTISSSLLPIIIHYEYLPFFNNISIALNFHILSLSYFYSYLLKLLLFHTPSSIFIYNCLGVVEVQP